MLSLPTPRRLAALLVFWISAAACAEEALPETLMTTRGRLLVSEDFGGPLAPYTGKPVGFASGFSGWKYNSGPGVVKSGRWELADGAFRGIEHPEAHHPATASYGIQYQDAIIQCEVRLNDVPDEGRKYRYLQIKATDAKDYVCVLTVGGGGLSGKPYDDSKINPATKQRLEGPATKVSQTVKPGEWHTLVLEIKGSEAVGTLDGKSLTFDDPLIGVAKHSFMLVAGTEASFRHLRMWEALPNADWPRSKAELLAKTKPAAADSKAAAPSAAETFRAEKLAELDTTIDHAIRDKQIVGAALWVGRNGASYHKAYGSRAPAPATEPMTEDTIFDVASITKVVATATAAMQCIERGLMQLDDPLSKHLPEFTGEGREKITLRHLLLHTSGLKTNLDPKTQPISKRDDAVAHACKEKPAFEPGSAYAYSSVGTMLLAAAIEKATGRAFDEYCTVEIFRPLGMNDTGFRPAADKLPRVAPSSAPQRGQVDDFMARSMGGVAGHASLFTTTADLARFARMMLNSGELEGTRVLRADTVSLMTRVQSPPELRAPGAGNLPVRRALGWDIDTPYRTPPHPYGLHRGALFPVGSYGHAGWTGQMLWIDPFSRTFVIFLCNRYQPGAPVIPDAAYHLHHRIATLAAESVKDFDFQHVPGALTRLP